MTRKTTSILLGADAPRVLTVPLVRAALSSGRSLPARATVFSWLREQKALGTLRPLTRGLFLNQMAQPRPRAGDAASYIRRGAIVSLQGVLGDAGVTNSYSDIVTCVIPIVNGIAGSSRPVKTPTAEFRFHAMPVHLLDDRAGNPEDRLDPDEDYPRATPEKALLDWIYLGRSSRTKISGPPLDTDLARLDIRRLRRLAKKMDLLAPLEDYLSRKKNYDSDPGVIANNSVVIPRARRPFN